MALVLHYSDYIPFAYLLSGITNPFSQRQAAKLDSVEHWAWHRCAWTRSRFASFCICFFALSGSTISTTDRAGLSLIVVLFALAIFLPHLLSLLLRATDNFWSRFVPAANGRHWLYFGLIFIGINVLPALVVATTTYTFNAVSPGL